MARVYLEKLSVLVHDLRIADEVALPIKVRHFFSGAALYVDNAICVSWSPAGLAFKFSEREADRLIASGEAKPMRYFANGHIKKEYALFEKPDSQNSNYWKKYLVKAVQRKWLD